MSTVQNQKNFEKKIFKNFSKKFRLYFMFLVSTVQNQKNFEKKSPKFFQKFQNIIIFSLVSTVLFY